MIEPFVDRRPHDLPASIGTTASMPFYCDFPATVSFTWLSRSFCAEDGRKQQNRGAAGAAAVGIRFVTCGGMHDLKPYASHRFSHKRHGHDICAHYVGPLLRCGTCCAVQVHSRCVSRAALKWG